MGNQTNKATKSITLSLSPHQGIRCGVNLGGKERCDGTGLIPINMKERAEIRNGIELFKPVDCTCGHKYVVEIHS